MSKTRKVYGVVRRGNACIAKRVESRRKRIGEELSAAFSQSRGRYYRPSVVFPFSTVYASSARYHFFSEERWEDREYRNKVVGTRVKQFVHSQGSKIEAGQWSVTTSQIEFYSQAQFYSRRACPVGTNRIRSLFRRVSLSFRFSFVPVECSVYLVSRFIRYAKRDFSTSRNSRNIDARTDLEVPSFTVHRFPLKRWL